MKGELDWVVLKALEKDRTRRYETANALSRDIQRYLADEVVEARPPSTGYRLKKFVRRHKGQVIAASLVLVSSFVGTAVASWQAVRASRAESNAIHAETLAKEERDKALLAEAVAISQSDLSYDALGDLVLKIQIDLDEAPGGRHVRRELLDDTMRKLNRLVESPATSDRFFRRYASAHMQKGEILWNLNRRGEAETEYKKAGEYAERAFRANPTSDKAIANVAANHNRMGDTELFYHKHLEPARKQYEAGLPLWEGLAKKMAAFPAGDPALPELERINLVDSEEAVADTYDRMGIVALRFDFDYTKAENWFTRSLEIRKRHLVTHPSRQHRVALGASYIYLAEMALQHNELNKAIKLHDGAGQAARGDVGRAAVEPEGEA